MDPTRTDTSFRLRVFDSLTKGEPLADWPFHPSGAADLLGAAGNRFVSIVRDLAVRWAATVAANRRLRVSPMSDTWLQTHAVEHAKHVDEA